MATHKGSEGSVAIGANTIAEVKGYSLEETAEVIEDTELSDSTKSFVAGNTAWSGSIDCQWDETDTNGQVAMTVGSSVTLNLYPEGSTTGDNYYTGTALITGITTQASINGIVETSFTFQGTGTLTRGNVS